VVDFLRDLVAETGLPQGRLLGWAGVARSKFAAWKAHYGKAWEHNGKVPRDHWLEPEERASILAYQAEHPLEGYRALTYQMIDEGVAAVSPATVHRVLRAAGVLERWQKKPSRKGKGFVQPLSAHEHWHMDLSYLNLSGTFYFLCTVLDGASRLIVHHEIRETMKSYDTELVLQRAWERYPQAKPRLISDNGPQFVARDFKELLRVAGMDHVRTSPYYPQSNGKIERWHKTIKQEVIRPLAPQSLEEARRLVDRFVEHYNTRRLHSALGYVTPHDWLTGKAPSIWEERDRRLEEARKRRAQRRAEERERAEGAATHPPPGSALQTSSPRLSISN
jgi:putative transposase